MGGGRLSMEFSQKMAKFLIFKGGSSTVLFLKMIKNRFFESKANTKILHNNLINGCDAQAYKNN